MSDQRITPDLSEALHRLVDADAEMRKLACGAASVRFDRATERFDQAAEKVAREAKLAGFSRGQG